MAGGQRYITGMANPNPTHTIPTTIDRDATGWGVAVFVCACQEELIARGARSPDTMRAGGMEFSLSGQGFDVFVAREHADELRAWAASLAAAVERDGGWILEVVDFTDDEDEAFPHGVMVTRRGTRRARLIEAREAGR